MDHDHGSLAWIIILWIIISHHWSWLNDHDHYHIGSSSWIVMFLQWKWPSVMEIMFLWPNDPFSLIIPCKLHECNVVTGPFIPLLSMEGHCCQWHGSIVVNFNGKSQGVLVMFPVVHFVHSMWAQDPWIHFSCFFTFKDCHVMYAF